VGVITHSSVALVNGVVYYMTAGCGNGTTCDTLLYFIYFREVTCTRWNGHDWVSLAPGGTDMTESHLHQVEQT